MEITINRLELDVDAEVLFDEIRDDITSLIEDAVDSAVRDAVSDHVPDAVGEELRYNFDIEDHIDYDRVVAEVNRSNGEGDESGRQANAVDLFMRTLDNPDVTTALRALMTPKVLSEIIDTPPVRDLLMRLIADQLVFGQPVEIASTEGMR
jgi:hypothetical protein